MMHELLADARRDRIRAIRELPETPHLAAALRRVLFADRDAEVRAAAARRLAAFDAAAWLVEALGDRSPLVRDAILRALAKCGDAACLAAIRARTSDDRMWWVRRTAIYALAAIGGAGEVATLSAALADPFWRVRHAAVKVLAVLGARDPSVRDLIEAPAPTLAFLRSTWGPTAIEAPRRALAPSLLPAALLDPDPAVVTARLVEIAASPLALVELLSDPHAPLRHLAARILGESGDLAAYEAALDWLEEPRIPHVADTVEHMLDRLGDPAAEIAARALARDRVGGARWAIAWVVATKLAPLYEAALARARTDARLRAGALAIASLADLLSWADAPLAGAIASELHGRRSPEAHAALLALSGADPRVRALQIDAAARRGDLALAERGHADPHHGPRAVAAYWTGRGTDDPDPAVREAALTTENARALVDDPDPWVARAAIRRLADSGADDTDLGARARASRDPFVRAQGCRFPIRDDAALATVFALARDPDEMVRTAAVEALARVPDLEPRLGEFVDLAAATTAARPRTPRAATEPAIMPHRAFGRAGFAIAPLVISGAYDLSPSSLAVAADAGIDAFFWEPGYHALTRFLRRRPGLRVIAGSYHADASSIEADVDSALRRLRRDTLDAFLLFWSRSPARVDAAAFAALDRIRCAGKVRAIGFSTHHRELARDALAISPWDVVMIRHSAAHPGIETELLPAARAHGTAILTFSTLCYGRMTSGPDAPSAADCIRYSLSQPGVTAAINAPRRYRDLVERLEACREPALPDERIAALRAHGVRVRAESQRFNTLMRQPTRDAAAAAREMLAAEPPPAHEIRLPPPAVRRR